MGQPCLAAGKNSTPGPGVLAHLLEGDAEHPGDLEGDLQRRRVLALLDGVEGLAVDSGTWVQGYPAGSSRSLEVAMSDPGGAIIGPAPDAGGPLVCTLPVDQFAGRLDAFRREVSGHLRSMERPAPARLRLVLGAGADPGRVRALLVREQACCAFLAFTITPDGDGLVVDLEVRDEASGALDGFAWLAGAAAR
jgi:hypothetical protein